ncbi:Peptidyl-prolyl cis-trans isomerase D [Marinomonas aquimarina]|uniref:Periplasmic chaperone PpiD n=1 Tax=Marinomonas aquimarina TaxID=295068 RepID=A0A1A8TBZ7_9GAMM|nr:SurA N-terminal domain-containing protein [Marinomonas aquimarina]SBS30228.1 Peptidyl-prolyl cis-trans isomerase D [Marinomonas aquimarina]
MLQDIRDKSQGMIVKTIIGVVIVTFALFGVEALVQSFTSTDTVAEVDGKEITRMQLLQASETQRRQLISMMGGQIDPAMLEENALQRRALDELIQRSVLMNQAESLNLGVSDAQVDAYLLQAEQFQTDGQFDQNKYLNFIRSLGFTPLAFKERIKQDVLIQQTRNALAGSEFVLPSQVDHIVALQNQKRSFDYVRYSLADKTEQVNVTDEELREYYDQNQASFVSPEQVKLDYVVVSVADIQDQVEVSDTELNDAYQARVASFQGEERAAAHILIDTSSRSSDEAQAVVAEIQAKLADGQAFADLAAEYSDDLGSKDNGGDLGYVSRGIMVGDFEDALFAMQEVGQVESVETEFGYHLIQLNDISETQAPSLDDMRAELMDELIAQKAKDQLLGEHENITDLAYASDDLSAIASAYGVAVLTTDYFGRNGGSDEISSAPAVISAAYSPTVLEDGHNSDLIELSEEEVVVVHVNDHKPAAQQTFAEAKDVIASIVVQQKAVDELQAQAEQALVSGETNWTLVEAAERGQDEVASLAFGLAHPAEGDVTTGVETASNGDLVAIRLTSVTEGDNVVEEAQKEVYQNYLSQTLSTLTLRAQQETLQNAAEIVRN